MNTEQLEEMFVGNTIGGIQFKQIREAFDPHPYTITPQHLQHNDSMYLGKTQIERMERERGPMCGWEEKRPKYSSRCQLKHGQHIYTKVVCILIPEEDFVEDDWQLLIKMIKELFGNGKEYGIGFIPPTIDVLRKRGIAT